MTARMRLNCLSCCKTYFSVSRTASLTTVPCAAWICATMPCAVITWSGGQDQKPVLDSPDYLSVRLCGTSYVSYPISLQTHYYMAYTIATSSSGCNYVTVDCGSAWSRSPSGLLPLRAQKSRRFFFSLGADHVRVCLLFNMDYIQRFSPYRAVNSLHRGYKNQSVNAV